MPSSPLFSPSSSFHSCHSSSSCESFDEMLSHAAVRSQAGSVPVTTQSVPHSEARASGNSESPTRTDRSGLASQSRASSPRTSLSTAEALQLMRERRRSSRAALGATPASASPRGSPSTAHPTTTTNSNNNKNNTTMTTVQPSQQLTERAVRQAAVAGAAATSSAPVASSTFSDIDAADVVLRRQRVDRAMLCDREAEGRHNLHREEQDMYMRFLVPFFQLLRECLRKSQDRDDALSQCRRLSYAFLSSPATPSNAHKAGSGSRSGSEALSAASPARASQDREGSQAVDTDGGVSPAPRLPVTRPMWQEPTTSPPSSKQRPYEEPPAHADSRSRSSSSLPKAPSPFSVTVPGTTHTKPPSPPHPSSSAALSTTTKPSESCASPSRPQMPSPAHSAERALVDALNAQEKEELEAAGMVKWFVGRVAWLLAEEAVTRATVSAEEAYDWHCLRAAVVSG